MAKKKVNNVVINDEELVPTTLGVYSNKAKNPVIIFFLLAIFLLIAFYMPDIQKGINKLLGKETNTQNNNGNPSPKPDPNPNPNPDPDPIPVEITKYQISPETVIDESSYKVTNMNLNGSVLSLIITAKTDIDLSSYYIELYDDTNMLLGRVKLTDEKLTAENTRNYSYTVPSTSTQVSITKKTADDYPEISLNYGDNNEGTITCKNSQGEEYIYTFTSDQLFKITYSYKYSSSNEDYFEIYTKYMSLDNKHKAIDGKITSSLINSDNGFDYTLIIDLEGLEADKLNQLTLNGLFKIKTKPKEVKFITESKGFVCEI